MHKTGEVCGESGFYKCNVHADYLVFIEKGHVFPECTSGPYGKHMTLWGPARKVSAIVAELKTSQV